jgi:ABC-type dipeptide/oligopeptide/nickel transport system permease subunit
VLNNNGYAALRAAPYLLLFPSIAIVAAHGLLHILGDGLRNAFDPP